jgi:hypothetical protein
MPHRLARLACPLLAVAAGAALAPPAAAAAGTPLPQPSAATAGAGAADERAYAAAVHRQIAANWIRPQSAGAALRCPVRIRQTPDGQVQDARLLPDCNADEATRASILRAIERAQPLPYGGFEKAFRSEIVVTFTGR